MLRKEGLEILLKVCSNKWMRVGAPKKIPDLPRYAQSPYNLRFPYVASLAQW